MAQRLDEICLRCDLFGSKLENHCDNTSQWDSLYRKILGYHCSYIHKLPEAMGLLASGETGLAMRDFICKNEPKYQPFLDVYRILEVTSNYTGFSAIV